MKEVVFRNLNRANLDRIAGSRLLGIGICGDLGDGKETVLFGCSDGLFYIAESPDFSLVNIGSFRDRCDEQLILLDVVVTDFDVNNRYHIVTYSLSGNVSFYNINATQLRSAVSSESVDAHSQILHRPAQQVPLEIAFRRQTGLRRNCTAAKCFRYTYKCEQQ